MKQARLKWYLLTLVALFGLSLASDLHAGQVTKKWGDGNCGGSCDYTGVTKDTYMDQGSSQINYGIAPYLWVGDYVSIGRHQRSLINFDLSALSGLISFSRQIVSAKIKLRTFCYLNCGSPQSMNIDVFRVKKSWVEGTKDGDTAGIGEPSWRWQTYNTTEWTGWGVENSADRETTAESTVTVSAEDTWYEWDVTNSLQYMFANNQYYGWLLKWQLEDTVKYYRLYSSEYTTDTSYRPYLEITYNDTPLTAIYYSVGTDSNSLYSGNASASSGVLTLASAAADKIGVGDEVRVGDSRYYITRRNSSTSFNIQNSGANNGTPGATNVNFSSTAITIYRAFNLLSTGISNSSDSSHLKTSNLVTGNYQLNWPCYNDGALNERPTVTGWTTGSSNYIRIYAPYELGEVGTSQRHAGVAGTGFRLAPVDVSGDAGALLGIEEEYVRVEGIEVDGSGLENAYQLYGIYGAPTISTTSDVRIDSCIVHDLHKTQTNEGWHVGIWINAAGSGTGAKARISNNIVYDITNVYYHAVGISVWSDTTSYAYNNTVYNIHQTKTGAGWGAAWGIQVASDAAGNRQPDLYAKNNYVGYVFADADSGAEEKCYSQLNGYAHLYQTTNVSSDDTGTIDNKDQYSTYFVRITDGSEDLHLRNNSNALWGSYGTDLDGDSNLPITKDIDGYARDASSPDIGADEFGGQFLFRRTITIDADQVDSSCAEGYPQNLPVLISLSGQTWLKTIGNGGRIYSSSGYDIIFRNSDGKTQLSHEIEKYDGTNGNLVAWVKVPALSKTADTTIYIYYGNPEVTSAPPASLAQGVWDSNFKAVYHLKETSGTQYDSTANANNSVSVSVTTQGSATGQIDGADDFTLAGSNNIEINDGDSLDIADAITLEAWINPSTTSGTDKLRIITKDASGGHETYVLRVYGTSGNDGLEGYINEAGTLRYAKKDTIITTGYQHVALTWDRISGDHQLRLFRNGSEVSSYTQQDTATSAIAASTDNLFIGNNDALNEGFGGGIDEVRISNKARDACWIKTEYNNQSSPGTFYTLGSEGAGAPTVVTLKSLRAQQYADGVLLKWGTSHEVNNLGFNVYREVNGELLRLTPELIAGSALLAGSGTQLTSGHHYVWHDFLPYSLLSAPRSPLSAVKYWLEDVDLKGKRTWHGPVEAHLSASSFELSAHDLRRAELLSEFGARLQEKYADFWKIQDFREKLETTNVTRYTLLGKTKKRNTNNESRITNNAALGAGPRANVSLSSIDERNEAPGGRKLSGALSDKPLKQSYEAQWSLAARPAMKLLVKQEGWYRVSQAELAAAGMNTNFNPKHLHLYADGNELPIRVMAEKESRFGPRDAIEFYGIGLDTPSTDTRVYWLVVGSRPGKRISVSRGQGGQASLKSFAYTAEAKERSFYYPALLNGEESNFFGPILYTYRVDQLLYVWDADTSSPEDALLEVALQGATAVPHRVKVFFNDAEVGEVSFSGQSQGRFQAEIPVWALHSGENLVSFIAHGGEMDVSLLDSIHLTYWRSYRAHENALKLTAQGGRQVSVTGFSHGQIQVVDITDPLSVMEVEGQVKAQGPAQEVSFRVPGRGSRTLLALGVEKAKSPSRVILNQPSNWHEGMRGYDLVVISHRDFLESLKPLKNLRENQGYSVALVDVEDVYDEFSFGSKTPQAIKGFLQRAKSSWQKAPRFVLLVGDASFDPRNYLGYGDQDYVPTKLIDTVHLETASDDWFVDFDNDGLPEMAIGRLPVQTAEEAARFVSKMIGYEKSGEKKEALVVADRVDRAGDFDFEVASEEVRALLPPSILVRKIFRGQFSSDAQARAELLSGMNQGPVLVNFIGHGSLEVWRGDLLTTDDAENLINGLQLPLFVNMTCLNGFFQAPYADSMAEALLKAQGGGAIAIWASSGLTEPDKQALMNKEMIKLLFNGQGLTLGEAMKRAKAATNDPDVRKTWILFGDPSTRLKP